MRRLSELLTEASISLDVIAAELESAQDSGEIEAKAPPTSPAATPVESPPTPAAVPPESAQTSEVAEPADVPEHVPTPKRSAPPALEPPWDELVERAIELLRAEPRRTWKPAELCRAARDSGIAVESLQGLHFGLMPRLRQRAAIREGNSGFQASELLSKAKDVSLPVEPAQPKRELPWPQIIPAAMGLLRADPDRLWGQAELVRAVRDSGVSIDNLQGVHFGLTGRLVGLGAVECDAEGKLRLSALVGGNESAPVSASKPTSESDPEDEVDALAEEIDACEMFLERMSGEQRNAQVAVWAGRAREIQDRWNAGAVAGPDRRSALRRVFGRLTRITREQSTGWIDALTPDWSTAWTVYIAYQTAVISGEEAPLLDEEFQAFWRGRLRGLLLPTRSHVPATEAAGVIAQASDWLDVEDDDLRAAKQRFGDVRRAVAPVVRRAVSRPPPPAEPPVEPPATVLSITRGRRAVVVGGQGAREEHRAKLQELLELAELDWAFSEKSATGVFARVEERVKHGTYDLVLFLAGYTSHKSTPLLKTIKAHRVPLVYLARGYSANQVIAAIEEQLVSKRLPVDEAVTA